ncbi:MAG: hypothetical protein HQM09_24230 [Candidatus Riflebacteria bacterium]|nr:hypothetical protein [Candidatus Riflebacteria bacterium]
MIKSSSSPCGSAVKSLFDEVQRQFRSWRRTVRVSGNRRIPESLWAAATNLAAKSTVHATHRLLGLDYNELKRRVILKCGEDCAALPGHRRSHTQDNVVPSQDLGTLCGFPSPSGVRSNALSADGFIEVVAPLASPPPREHQLLAEIQSATGHVMRLYSSDAVQLVRAFLQP